MLRCLHTWEDREENAARPYERYVVVIVVAVVRLRLRLHRVYQKKTSSICACDCYFTNKNFTTSP